MGEPGSAPEAQPGRGCGLPRATAKRPAAPLGSVPPDKEARWGRAGGESEWKRNWVRRRETGAEGRTAALTLLLEKSPPIPVRGDRLDLNCLPSARPSPSQASPRHRRHISSPNPARLSLGMDPAPHSHPRKTRPAPHLTYDPSGSAAIFERARAPSPAHKRGAHVTSPPDGGFLSCDAHQGRDNMAVPRASRTSRRSPQRL